MLSGALIGCGPAGRLHLAAWKRVRTARIEAVLDIDGARAAAAAHDFGIRRHYADLDRLLAETRPDFADLACGVDAQPAAAGRCLEAGLHLLAETPLAPALERGTELVDQAEARGRRLMVAYAERWRSAFRLLKSTLEAGAVGRMHYARIFERRPLSRVPPADPERPSLDGARHLLVLEGLTGYLDLARWLFAEPVSVWGAAGHINPILKGEDFALALLRTDTDPPVCIALDINWSSPLPGRAVRPAPGPQLRVEGDAGALEMDFASGTLSVRRHAGAPIERRLPAVPDRRVEPYVELQGHFAECLESGKPMENGGRAALLPLAAALAVYESARAGSLVLLRRP